jgi:hypothetical protein
MVRHDQIRVPHLTIRQQRTSHIHVTLVRKGLLKITAVPTDVAEVDVEDLTTFSEIADALPF